MPTIVADGDEASDAIEVFAAGGLVWRPAPGVEEHEFLIVARPRRGDWSLPKGKLEAGETLEQCALREVREETGLMCALGALLPAQRYVDQRGRSKQVSYWTMTVLTGEFTPNAEVDRIEWLPAAEAVARLSYETDRSVVAHGATLLRR